MDTMRATLIACSCDDMNNGLGNALDILEKGFCTTKEFDRYSTV
jgi:hypothetical protein